MQLCPLNINNPTYNTKIYTFTLMIFQLIFFHSLLASYTCHNIPTINPAHQHNNSNSSDGEHWPNGGSSQWASRRNYSARCNGPMSNGLLPLQYFGAMRAAAAKLWRQSGLWWCLGWVELRQWCGCEILGSFLSQAAIWAARRRAGGDVL